MATISAQRTAPNGGAAHLSRQARTVFLAFLVSMETCVNCECSFDGTEKIVLRTNARVLDLECGCPESKDIKTESVVIRKLGYIPISSINKKRQNAKDRAFLELNDKQYQHGDNFTCEVIQRPAAGGQLYKRTYFWHLETPATTTTTTISSPPTTTTATTTYRNEEDIVEIAATTVSEGDSLSGVGLYVVVGISCVLIVTIVVFIICFVRVRNRRRREKRAQADLDMDDGCNFNRANQNLVYNSPEKRVVHCPHRDRRDLLHDPGDWHTCDSPACNLIFQNDVSPSPNLTPGQQQALGGIDRQRKNQKAQGNNYLGWDSVPLMTVKTRPRDRDNNRRRSITSEGEDGDSRRRKLLADVPRKTRARDNSPFLEQPFDPCTVSHGVLDSVEGRHIPRRFRVRRYSLPRIFYDEDYDSGDEEVDAPRHYPGIISRRHSPRSLSHNTLYRSPKHRTAYLYKQDPYTYRDRQPDRSILSDYEDYPLKTYVASARHFQGCSDSEILIQRQPIKFRDTHAQHAIRSPATVHIRDDKATMHHNNKRDFLAEDVIRYGGNGAVYRHDETYRKPNPLPARPGVVTDYPVLPHKTRTRRPAASDSCLTSGDERDGTTRGDPPPNGMGNSPKARRYQVSNRPLRRHHQYAASPGRLQGYNTTSMPRHKSAKRACRAVRNRPQPLHYCRSDGELDYLPFSLAPEIALDADFQPLPQYHPSRLSQTEPQSRMAGKYLEHDGQFPSPSRDCGTSVFVAAVGHEGNSELARPPPQPRSEAPGQMNFLSRDGSVLVQGPNFPLNLPMGQQDSRPNKSLERQEGDTHPKTAIPARLATKTASGSKMAQTSVRNGPKMAGVFSSESSPDTTPPPPTTTKRHHHRHSSTSSSDSDNDDVPTIRRRRDVIDTCDSGEIIVRDIKTDNETRRKQPVSVRTKQQAPIVCATDIALSHNRKTRQPHPSSSQQHDVHRQGSAASSSNSAKIQRSRGASGGSRAPKDVMPLEQFGVDVVTSPEQSVNATCSNFTETNHSTTAKHIRPPADG